MKYIERYTQEELNVLFDAAPYEGNAKVFTQQFKDTFQ